MTRRRFRKQVPVLLLLTSAAMLSFAAWKSPAERIPAAASKSSTLGPPDPTPYQIGKTPVKVAHSPSLARCVDVEYVVLVPSAPRNVRRRSLVRDTWARLVGPGNPLPNVSYFFVMGRSSNDVVVKRIDEEASEKGDVLLFDFHDAYLNLTTKVCSGNW